MLKENPLTELTEYIRRLDEDEQSSLLKEFRRRDALAKAHELDKKQRASMKGRKRLTDIEIAAIVRNIRKANARKKA